MRKQTSLYIPKPCHEDWNNMTPTQQGKFCGSCSKQVIDFSLMSDNQVLHFLSQQSGKICGRFDTDQLQRPLIETKISKKKSWWMALAMPLLFLFNTAKAQRNVKFTGDTLYTVQPWPDTVNCQLTGKVAVNDLVKSTAVNGKVVDEDNQPLADASVVEKGKRNGTVTDNAGNFSIRINQRKSKAILVVSSIGYQSMEKEINLNADNPDINLKLQLNPTLLGDVVVTGYTISRKRVRAIDTLQTTIKKVFNNSDFKVYPNPTGKASDIHIQVKQPGKYEIQLFDNQSSLVKIDEINTSIKKSIETITIPSNISSGTYYLCLVDEQTHKTTTEKLIIQ
jgi:CarboxypepD_reg-like domain/Secretion system C-terminal sorting domain